MGSNDAQLDFTFCKIRVQRDEHSRPGHIDHRRVGKVTDHEP